MARYPYRDLGITLDRDFRNNLNANFDDIEADLRDIQSNLDAKESRLTQIENDSIERDNDLDARIDNIVADAGNSNTEIVDARNDSVNNVTYPTLKDRLDDTSDKIGILNEQLTDISLNVKAFGAKGDGINDDSNAISLAINHALAYGYKKIFFPTGTYLIVNSLQLKGGLEYIGNKATILLSLETSYLSIKENSWTIDGINFDANNVVTRALYVEGSENFYIKNCLFKNGTKWGLHVYNGKKGRIINCKFENSGRNDFMSAGCAILGTNIDIVNCEASGNTLGNGFITYSDSTYKSNNITYNNCVAKINIQHGFVTAHTEDVSNRVNNVVFIGCVADGNGGIFNGEYMFGGIVLHDANGAVINGCTTINNYEHGIAVMDSDNITITNNLSRNNKRCGIRLQADWSRLPQDVYSGVKKCLIANNQCLNNGIEDKYWSSGILIEGNCHYITCSDNIISGNYYSIYTKKMDNFSDCTNVYLNNNVMYGNIVSNDWFNTMEGGSVFGENFVAGVRKKIDRILEEQEGHTAYALRDVLTPEGILTVEDKAVYYAVTGDNVTINGLDTSNYPVGTTFYICFRGYTSNGSITINSGTGLIVPGGSFVINQANGNQEVIFKFVKTAGTSFRMMH